MISNTFEPKHSITPSPVLPTAPVKRQPSVAALRFGSDDDSATVTTSLPEWTKKVKDPKVTLPGLFLGEDDDQTKKSNKRPSSLAFIWNIFVKKPLQVRHFLKELNANHDEYLPEQVKKDLRKYHWKPSYWFNRIFHSRKAKIMNVVYRGPIAIKTKQMLVSELPGLRQSVKNLEGQAKEERFSEKLGTNLKKFFLKRQIKKIEIYSSLLNKVPALPFAKFEKQLKELESTYNNAHSSNPIETIDKSPIGTGSMGQVYQATTKNGEKLVLKVIKPDITPQFLGGCLPLVYYYNMLTTGKKPQDKLESATKAQETINILKDEATPEKEANNTKLMQVWANKLNIKEFQITDLVTQTPAGIITRFVGDKDVADLKDSEKDEIKTKLSPDLIKFFMLSAAKPLDLHEGNIRTGTPAYWIDHGRQININEDAHKKMLNLITATFKSPQSDPELSFWDNVLLNPGTKESFKALLSINPNANKQALENLNQMEQLGDITESIKKLNKLKKELSSNSLSFRPEETPSEKRLTQEAKQLESSIKPYLDIKKQLSKILGQPPNDNALLRKLQAKYNIAESLPEPSLLNAWASSALHLPGYAQAQLPQSDINQYRQKASNFLAPYVRDTSAKVKEIKRNPYSSRKISVITDNQEEKLKTLSNELANGLLEQTGIAPLTETEHEQLKKNIKHTLQKELLPGFTFKEDLPKD